MEPGRNGARRKPGFVELQDFEMPHGENLTFAGRLRSFRYAVQGIATMLRSQHNAWIHMVASIVVVVLGIGLGISTAEWCWIVLAIVAVWTAEALNTALEFLTDVASPSFHPLAGKAKDVAAGAVLISAIGAVVIGLFVLGPRLYAFLGLAV
ncbi:MAG: diacylglycerol kinase family protein [Planctomycetaceae bacterium]